MSGDEWAEAWEDGRPPEVRRVTRTYRGRGASLEVDGIRVRVSPIPDGRVSLAVTTSRDAQAIVDELLAAAPLVRSFVVPLGAPYAVEPVMFSEPDVIRRRWDGELDQGDGVLGPVGVGCGCSGVEHPRRACECGYTDGACDCCVACRRRG